MKAIGIISLLFSSLSSAQPAVPEQSLFLVPGDLSYNEVVKRAIKTIKAAKHQTQFTFSVKNTEQAMVLKNLKDHFAISHVKFSSKHNGLDIVFQQNPAKKIKPILKKLSQSKTNFDVKDVCLNADEQADEMIFRHDFYIDRLTLNIKKHGITSIYYRKGSNLY